MFAGRKKKEGDIELSLDTCYNAAQCGRILKFKIGYDHNILMKN